jgi:hypothetical protein
VRSKNIFSENEIGHIQSSWSHVLRMFEQHAHLKDKFIFAHSLETEEEMRQNSQLVYHAMRIIHLIYNMVRELNSVNIIDYQELVNLDEVNPADFQVKR